MTTLEAIAWAMHIADGHAPGRWNEEREEEKTLWMSQARVSIKALSDNISKEMSAAGYIEAEDAMDEDWDSGGDGESYNSYTTLRSDAPAKIFIAMLAAALNEENKDEP